MQVVPFVIFVLVGTFSPGPNIVMSIESGRTRGVRASLPLFAGMSAGFGCIMLSAALFDKYLVEIVPSLRPFLGAGGALYMLWLAVRQFAPKKQAAARPGGAASFLTGVALQFVNPKVILYGIAVMAGFILPSFDAFFQLTLFSAGLALVCFVSLLSWGYFGAVFQKRLAAHEKLLDVTMALLLLYCAYSVSGIGGILFR